MVAWSGPRAPAPSQSNAQSNAQGSSSWSGALAPSQSTAQSNAQSSSGWSGALASSQSIAPSTRVRIATYNIGAQEWQSFQGKTHNLFAEKTKADADAWTL